MICQKKDITEYQKCRIMEGWEYSGQEGRYLDFTVFVEQEWSAVLWDDEQDPTFAKSASLELCTQTWEEVRF